MPQALLNGEAKLQLKPKNDEQKEWTATLPVNEILGTKVKNGDPIGVNGLLVKATVLGGAIKTPIWTGNSYPLHVTPELK